MDDIHVLNQIIHCHQIQSSNVYLVRMVTEKLTISTDYCGVLCHILQLHKKYMYGTT